jgi:thioredoxin 1
MPNVGLKPTSTRTLRRLFPGGCLLPRRNISDRNRLYGSLIINDNQYFLEGKPIYMAEGILTLTDSTFDEQVGSAAAPMLVDFWAEWCAPCKKLVPILEDIASEQAGKITIAKLNIDENPEIARRFDVMSIPTLLLFKDGELVQRTVGAKGKDALLADMAQHL